MAKTSKKPTSTSTPTKWRIVSDTEQTDVEADRITIDDSGVLTLTDKAHNLIAAWNAWRSVVRLPPEPPPQPEASA